MAPRAPGRHPQGLDAADARAEADAVAQDEEIRQLREANRRLTEDLRKAEIVIDVQKKVAALLEDLKPSSGSKEPR